MGRAYPCSHVFNHPAPAGFEHGERIMLIRWAPILALVIGGCGKPEVSACEEFLKESLRSPATYKQVRADIYDEPITPEKLTTLGGRPWGGETLAIRKVFVEYDAENAFGAPIREAQLCGFVLRNGTLPDSNGLKAAVALASAKRSYQRVKESVGQADPEYQEPEYSCCL